MKRLQGTLWFIVTLSALAVFTALGPAEKTLGTNARLVYLTALWLGLQATENVMHPPAPMLQSGAPRIQLYFAGLVLLTLLAACRIARWWHQFERTDVQTSNHSSASSQLR